MDTETAVNFLTNKLKRDEKFRDTYIANISMSFYDAFHEHARKTGLKYSHTDIVKISKTGAENFLKLWCEK